FCDGRTVTVMWLALAGRPDPVADLRRVRLDDSDTGSALVISQTEPTYMTAAHTEVVRAMLDRPRSETAAKVRAHWDELTAPKVTTDRVAEVLGLPSPEGEGTCLCRDGGRRRPGRNGRHRPGDRPRDTRPDGGHWCPGWCARSRGPCRGGR